VFADVQTLTSYLEMGGFVMPPLILVGVLLWYGLVFRMLSIKKSRHNPRKLLRKARKGKLRSKAITARAAMMANEAAGNIQSRQELKSFLNEKFHLLQKEMNQHKALVRSLVLVAPLLGLLGTVDGMIETFDALGDMALFTQSGGIAGGISRALFTTQMGLAISIPGLLIGRMIDRRQLNISRELDQIRDLICAKQSRGHGNA
jgi:biopolymer transport protein ExbB